jgi:peroxin-14
MATVVGGASYGLYVLAQRYVKPLIAPPTPPQLEQDKAAIDEQFNKAFALLDTLSADTTALKEAEEARTQRLDTAITDIETIVAELKAANMRREDDARRMESEIKNMKDSLPRSIDSVREASERQLKELSTELGSLKVLMGNRLGGSSAFGPAGQGLPRTQPGTFPGSSSSASNSAAQTPSTETAPSNVATSVPRPTPSYTSSSSAVPTSASVSANRPGASTPGFPSSANKAAIPAWQMAAANKAKDLSSPSPAAASHGSNVPVTNGSSSQPQDGAEAVAALNAS